MNYAKPEVAVLGKAVRVIEQFTLKNQPVNIDPASGKRTLNAAYDLDE